MMKIPIALSSVACASVLVGCAADPVGVRAVGTGRQDLAIHVQFCVPGRAAVVDEIIVDASNIPEDLSERDWQDILLKATATGRREGTDVVPRILVTSRSTRPSEGPDAADRSLNVGTVELGRSVASRGGGGVVLSDSTQRNQPVYLKATGAAAGELKGVYVMADLEAGGQRRQVRYWFIPPARIVPGEYTPWMLPVYQDDGVWSKPDPSALLWAGKPLPAGTVDMQAPRVRYTLARPQDSFFGSRQMERAMRARELGRVTGVDRVVSGPRAVSGVAPGC